MHISNNEPTYELDTSNWSGHHTLAEDVEIIVSSFAESLSSLEIQYPGTKYIVPAGTRIEYINRDGTHSYLRLPNGTYIVSHREAFMGILAHGHYPGRAPLQYLHASEPDALRTETEEEKSAAA